MHLDSLKSVFPFLSPCPASQHQKAEMLLQGIQEHLPFGLEYALELSVSGLDLHNPKGLQQTQDFQEPRKDPRQFHWVLKVIQHSPDIENMDVCPF